MPPETEFLGVDAKSHIFINVSSVYAEVNERKKRRESGESYAELSLTGRYCMKQLADPNWNYWNH